MMKKGSRKKRSRYEDHLPRHDDDESHSRTTTNTTTATNCTGDNNNQTPQSHISSFTSYFRQRREVVPFQSLPLGEVETVDKVGHASPISCNAATPADVTLGELTKGSECEEYTLDAIEENVHFAISIVVKSVLSEHGNSSPEHSKDSVRVLGHEYSSVRKATTDMKDYTFVDRSQSAKSPVLLITEIVPVAESSQESYPDRPLPHVSSSNCDLNTTDQLQTPKPIHNKILIEISGNESKQTDRSLDLPLALFSSSACDLNVCDPFQQLEPIHNKMLIENSGDSHSPKLNMSLNFTEMMNALDSDDDDDECSSRREPTVETVEGYIVRKEFAPTLYLLIAKYGDFAANCSFQYEKNRSFFLEQTCEIVEQLQNLDLTKVTLAQLESMLAFVSDSEHVIDLKWLKKRLEEIMEAKSIIMQSRPLKEEKIKSKQEIEETKKAIEEKKRAIEALQEETKKFEMNLAALEEESNIINGKCIEATRKVKSFYNRRLGYDLL